jgi:hypothetical protein
MTVIWLVGKFLSGKVFFGGAHAFSLKSVFSLPPHAEGVFLELFFPGIMID